VSGEPWFITANGVEVFRETFSNVTGVTQSFGPQEANAPGTGSAEQNTLGYDFDFENLAFDDTVYRIAVTFPHTANALNLVFRGNLADGADDRQWGIDNFRVRFNR
jgi:hypothetical protein